MTSQVSPTLPITWFGKLPSEGDFLKGTEHRPLIAVLDQWVSEGLKLLTEDVAWKTVYDSAHAVNFALMGTRRHTVVGGRLLPSHDVSGRRFPFMTAVTYEAELSPRFVAHVPQAMSRLWSRMAREMEEARISTRPGTALSAIAASPITLTVQTDVLRAIYDDFLDSQTIGSLQDMLDASGHQVDIRRIFIGLGILMKPVRALQSPKMAKGLRLPLPADPMYQQLVSTFWLDLVAGFLDRVNFDLVVLQRNEPVPMMTLGFRGVNAKAMHGVFDARVEAADTVLLDDPDWVEDQVQDQYALKKLSNYCHQSSLSLRTANATFLETFLGA